jgi:hypothetical protein
MGEAPGTLSPAGLPGLIVAVRDLAEADDAARIDQLRLLEELRSATAATHARITAAFVASQRAAAVAAVEGLPAPGRQARRVGGRPDVSGRATCSRTTSQVPATHRRT